MKELLIIRHAKSSWANIDQSDFERPLNERGQKDAPEMAKRIIKRVSSIDSFIASTAIRAFSTATYFAEAYNKKETDINKKQELYLAPSITFYQVLEDVEASFNTISIVAHNPGITDFINSLGTTQIDNMPTCGVFAVKLHTTDWKEIKTCKKEFWFFDYPKLG